MYNPLNNNAYGANAHGPNAYVAQAPIAGQVTDHRPSAPVPYSGSSSQLASPVTRSAAPGMPQPAGYGSIRHDPGRLPPARTGLDGSNVPESARRAARPTLLPAKSFAPDRDTLAVYKAMKGLGTDERRIIDILGHRSAAQRAAIAETFQQNYKKKLTDALASELSFNFKAVTLALMKPPAVYDACEVRDAVKGAGTDDATLIEVLCGRNNQQIRELKDAYQKEFSRDIVADVTDDTSGDYQKLLLEILKGQREPEGPVNEAAAKEDAALLYKAGEAKIGTDEDTFIRILTTRSFAHLQAVMGHYQKLSDYDIERAIKKEMSANLKRALVSICQFARNPYEYYANRLESMMKGAGTNDKGLIRIIVSRCEIDLGNIKAEYFTLFKRSLEAAVKSETSGNYREMLNALISGDESGFNPEVDAKTLRRAMKGIGTDNDKLMQVLGTRSNEQRQMIAAAYKSAYQRSLREDLRKETSGDFSKLLDCMMMTPPQLDAWTVNRCVKGLGTDDDTLIEVLCTRSNMELRAMMEEYKVLFNKDCVADVRDDTSGDYQDLLLALLAAQRDESNMVNPVAAKEDASALYKAGEGKVGTDEKAFIDILTRRNFYQLRLVFDEYDKMCDYSLEASIKRETSFNFRRCLIAIVRAVREPAAYFAERLMQSMKGAGTNDLQLIRVILNRSEVDMADIRDVYHKNYKMSLEKAIENDTSGFYKKLLIKIIEYWTGSAPMAF